MEIASPSQRGARLSSAPFPECAARSGLGRGPWLVRRHQFTSVYRSSNNLKPSTIYRDLECIRLTWRSRSGIIPAQL